MTRQIKLGAFLPGGGQHAAAWHHPDQPADGVTNFEFHTQFAQAAQRGLFDAYFLADGLAVSFGGGTEGGNARAPTVQPEILLLDEPLGALYAMTKMTMQEELVRIWTEESVTMMLVTHDLEEAIFLADRVLVRPKTKDTAIRLIDIDLPHPRDRSDPDFIQNRRQLMAEFGLH